LKNIKILIITLLFINNNFNLIRIINLNEKEDYNYFLNNYYKENSIKKSEYRWNIFYYDDFLKDLIIKNTKKIKNINNYFLLEISEDQNIIGGMRYKKFKNRIEICNLEIQIKNLGLGKIMIDEIKRISYLNGNIPIVLDSVPSAIGFYEKLNFSKINNLKSNNNFNVPMIYKEKLKPKL